MPRRRDVAFHFGGDRQLGIGIFDFSCAMQATTQALLIAEHQLAQLGRQCLERRFHVQCSLFLRRQDQA
ncbi:hypothetical protein AK51_06750 [Serratia nematodiphila DZ0503SBS1]|nr:hypothetical protein AK51_06750 [Serratia nematodiphila DZ0503SBS1]